METIVHEDFCCKKKRNSICWLGSSPGGSRVIRRGDGIAVLGKNLFNYRYRERLETDSVVGNLGGAIEAEQLGLYGKPIKPEDKKFAPSTLGQQRPLEY